jgi:acetyl-CoA synthetase
VTRIGTSRRNFSRYGPEIYVAGDGAKRDEDGYFWLLGRIDDVMNVAGHRLSTFEIESALVDKDKVAESAVVSKPDDVVGEAIVVFVTLSPDSRAAMRWRRSFGRTSRRDRQDRSTARDHLHRRPSQDPFRQDHAAAAPRRGARRPLGHVTTLADAEIVERIRGMTASGGEE